LSQYEKEEDMKPTPPSEQRRELIEKGHTQPDPMRDALSQKQWNGQEKFLTKVQQSWRRTMDDVRGRSKTLEERAKDTDQAER
jgi:hypothetical protein